MHLPLPIDIILLFRWLPSTSWQLNHRSQHHFLLLPLIIIFPTYQCSDPRSDRIFPSLEALIQAAPLTCVLEHPNSYKP